MGPNILYLKHCSLHAGGELVAPTSQAGENLLHLPAHHMGPNILYLKHGSLHAGGELVAPSEQTGKNFLQLHCTPHGA